MPANIPVLLGLMYMNQQEVLFNKIVHLGLGWLSSIKHKNALSKCLSTTKSLNLYPGF